MMCDFIARTNLSNTESNYFVHTIIIFDLSYYTNITWHHRVKLVRRVAQEPSVRGSNPSGARVQWNEGCAEHSVGGSNPYKME